MSLASLLHCGNLNPAIHFILFDPGDGGHEYLVFSGLVIIRSRICTVKTPFGFNCFAAMRESKIVFVPVEDRSKSCKYNDDRAEDRWHHSI